MKKVTFILAVLLLVIGLILVGCAQPSPSPTQPPAPPTTGATPPTKPPPPTQTPPATQPPPTTQAPPPPTVVAPPPPVKAVKLTFANWLPPMNPCTKVYEQWAKDFEAATGGRYTVEVVSGGALASIPEAYDKVANGIVDIAMFVAQDVQKPFPVINMSALPWSHLPGQVYTEAWKKAIAPKGYMDKELTGVKLVIQYWGPGEDWFTMDPINKMADMQGVKMLGGGGVKPDIAKALGAVWVFGGPPDAYEKLQKNIVRGVAISGLGLEEFHWSDYLKYLIDPLRMTGVIHNVVINKAAYDKLPADVKTILDNMDKDGKYSMKAATDFEALCAGTIDTWLKSGKGTLIKWSPEELTKLNAIIAPIWDAQIKSMNDQGAPATQVINDFYNALKGMGIATPAVGYTPK